MTMSKTEVDFKASVVYRIWRSVQKKLQRESDMPENYRLLKPCWKKPFQAVARLKIPAIVEAWNSKRDRIRAMHAAGTCPTDIAATLKVARSSVYRFLPPTTAPSVG